MLRQYLSFLLLAITAATVNAGCCNFADGCADTSALTREQVGGSYRESSCGRNC
ncbi:hypothetical protein HBH95_192970 [Parastagonospora nodorum]|nr:hypothetical protein HBH95_192970 [Parastagonospora nodorum]